MEHMSEHEHPGVTHTFLAHNLAGLGLYQKELREELLLAADETEDMTLDEQYKHLMSLADYAHKLTGWDTSNGHVFMVKTGVETKILKKALRIPGIMTDTEKHFDIHERLLSSLSNDMTNLQNINHNALSLQYMRTTTYEDQIKTAQLLKRLMGQHPEFYNRLLEYQFNDILRPVLKYITTVYVSPEYL